MKGTKIFLREMRENDIDENYLSWFKNQEVTNFLSARNISLEDARAFFRKGIETKEHYQLAICANETEEMIGSVKIGPIDRQHSLSDLVTIIGNPNYWGKGLAKEAISLASEYAFNILNIRKLSGGMISGNIGSVKGYTNAGWLVEGILLGHYLHDINGTQDRVAVSCFNPKYFSEEQLKPVREFSRNYLSKLPQRA